MTVADLIATGRVSVPTGTHGDAEIRRLTVDRSDTFHSAIRGRGTTPGQYTALYIRGRLWMSDTDAEWRDHSAAVNRIRRPGTRRVLINGLGIGMVVQAALDCDHIEHVDVVELDPDVAALVGPHYEASGRVTVHVADAYTIKWPPNTRWDVAWHDIWADLSTDNLPAMSRLHRKYGRAVSWQGSWGREMLQSRKRQEDRQRAMWRW